ncbi:uncharacterized protein K444DRAFT_391968 [Hyaloscypha bicolor E]|uniref:Granulins domain-containing protein n=1 Tax=Hyaloscypha bicolor E TaxID=1095630 RepID=A0A2J6TBI4_9HELO|nr:uncharacterized protein K444DRAFT_391968 [Hyaloscypha bicolor E]PMD60385.1 hypothetical protein K444DRAFT_391968 [Hyaloscypha bicolor E]
MKLWHISNISPILAIFSIQISGSISQTIVTGQSMRYISFSPTSSLPGNVSATSHGLLGRQLECPVSTETLCSGTSFCCDFTEQCCSDSCAPLSAVCCSDGLSYCTSGEYCCGDGRCALEGGVCCSDGFGSCLAGQICIPNGNCQDSSGLGVGVPFKMLHLVVATSLAMVLIM